MLATLTRLLELHASSQQPAKNRSSVDSHQSLKDRFSPNPQGCATDEDEYISFAGLVPQPVILSLVDDFFRCSHNQPYSFFHEQSFRRRLSDGLIPNYLLFAVLATAVRFSSHPFFESQAHEAAITFANKSWKAIVSSCFARDEKATIMTIQTITLLAIFDFTAGQSRHGSAWIKIGISVRIAQDLRLMMDSSTDFSYVDQEERRRVFWSLYLLDRIVSCGRARPPAILEASCQLQLPCGEKEWREGRQQVTDTLDQLSDKMFLQKESHGPFALVIIMAYILSRAAQYMLQEYNARSRYPPWDPNSDFASICSDLLYIESSFDIGKPVEYLISEELNDAADIDYGSVNPMIFSRALFHLCHCLLNHPFLLRHRLDALDTRAPSSFLARAFDFGRGCAKRLTQLLSGAASSGPFIYAPFYGYCAVVAGSIQALYLDSTNESIRLEAVDCVQENLTILKKIGSFWINVSVMSETLSSFYTDSPRFGILKSPEPQITPLSQPDQEVMWSLVDYNTMSNAPKLRQAYNPDLPHIMDTSLQQWLDLFGSQELELDTSAEVCDQMNLSRPMVFLDEPSNGSISFIQPHAEGRSS
ncbi:hypothetical protein NPX13_g9383 [Xylaria arbuscula]|uniref:Xylanolytic transcriptional activator regulatory domain-containing protein n=1 Tax=Xylaria arbuscula TaxID=114810 RepID=A0A9W8N6T6_9PEZI|nr:hypothetical protein NPX13_g9383 [Xylaria arbuscula]